jgi:hypothetical protein
MSRRMVSATSLFPDNSGTNSGTHPTVTTRLDGIPSGSDGGRRSGVHNARRPRHILPRIQHVQHTVTPVRMRLVVEHDVSAHLSLRHAKHFYFNWHFIFNMYPARTCGDVIKHDVNVHLSLRHTKHFISIGISFSTRIVYARVVTLSNITSARAPTLPRYKKTLTYLIMTLYFELTLTLLTMSLKSSSPWYCRHRSRA